jgi:hypothetical protein
MSVLSDRIAFKVVRITGSSTVIRLLGSQDMAGYILDEAILGEQPTATAAANNNASALLNLANGIYSFYPTGHGF